MISKNLKLSVLKDYFFAAKFKNIIKAIELNINQQKIQQLYLKVGPSIKN